MYVYVYVCSHIYFIGLYMRKLCSVKLGCTLKSSPKFESGLCCPLACVSPLVKYSYSHSYRIVISPTIVTNLAKIRSAKYARNHGCLSWNLLAFLTGLLSRSAMQETHHPTQSLESEFQVFTQPNFVKNYFERCTSRLSLMLAN